MSLLKFTSGKDVKSSSIAQNSGMEKNENQLALVIIFIASIALLLFMLQ
jgi:hypothetical protein